MEFQFNWSTRSSRLSCLRSRTKRESTDRSNLFREIARNAHAGVYRRQFLFISTACSRKTFDIDDQRQSLKQKDDDDVQLNLIGFLMFFDEIFVLFDV